MRTRVLSVVIATLALTGLGAPASHAATKSTLPTITVSGTGTVMVERNRATTSLSLSVTDRTARGAQDNLKKVTVDVRTAILNTGVKASALKTTGLSLYPEYEYRPESKPELIGYRAFLSITVVSGVDQASGIIDAAVDAGGDATSINGISFDSSKVASATAASRTRAVKDARVKAAQYAKAAGMTLGQVVTIVETSTPYVGPIYAKAAQEDAALPLDPGRQEIMTTVTVTFRIR
jgi:uncharacterized protein